jgi:hypothetical protein
MRQRHAGISRFQNTSSAEGGKGPVTAGTAVVLPETQVHLLLRHCAAVPQSTQHVDGTWQQ